MPLPIRPSLFSRLSLFYFAHFVWGGLFMAYFPLYLAARGLGAVEIGWIVAAPQIARTFAPAAFGALADRSGAVRGLVMFACAAAAAGFALLPFAQSFASLAVLIAVASVFSAGALPLVEALTLGALARDPGRYGPIRLWGSVGFIAAVMAGGAWLDLRPVHGLPWALLAFALVAFAAAASLPAERKATHRATAPFTFSPAVRALLGAGFCMAFAHGALYAFLTLHLERLGYSASSIGMLWTVGVLAEIVVFVYLPFVFRRFSLSAILVASFGCAVVRFLLLGWFAERLVLLFGAQLLHAATFGAFHAASVALVHRVVPEGAHARGQTVFASVTYGAGGAVGMVSAGWLWQAAGPGGTFSGAAAAGLAGLLFAHRLKRAGL